MHYVEKTPENYQISRSAYVEVKNIKLCNILIGVGLPRKH